MREGRNEETGSEVLIQCTKEERKEEKEVR